MGPSVGISPNPIQIRRDLANAPVVPEGHLAPVQAPILSRVPHLVQPLSPAPALARLSQIRVVVN